MPPPTYKYSLLEDAITQIRLLKPKPFASLENLSFSLATFELNNVPPYAAISYVCGPPEPLTHIQVDGFSMHIRKNCAHALRQALGRSSLQYIWVDAICINQDDLEEKNCQVFRMGDIYSKASIVNISLECDDDDIFILTEPAKVVQNTVATHADNRMHQDRVQALLAKSYKPEYLLERLCHVLDRVYWTRLWIVQEVLLAKRIYVWCFADSIELQSLCELWEALNWLAWTTESLKKYYRQTTTLFQLYHRRSDRLRVPSSTLRLLPDKQCADDRDRIYGALSIIPWSKELPPIKPDYSRSLIEVALEALTHLDEFANCLGCGAVTRMHQIWPEVELIIDLLRITPDEGGVEKRIASRRDRERIDYSTSLPSLTLFGEAAVAKGPSQKVQVQPEGVCPLFEDDDGRLTTCLHGELFLVKLYPSRFYRTCILIDHFAETHPTYRKFYCDGVAAGIVDSHAQPGDLLAMLDSNFTTSHGEHDMGQTWGLILRNVQGSLREIVGQAILWLGHREEKESGIFSSCNRPFVWDAEEHFTLKLFLDAEDLFISVCQDHHRDEREEMAGAKDRVAIAFTSSRFSSYGWYSKYPYFGDSALDG